MRDLLQQVVSRASDQGAGYADARYEKRDSSSVLVTNGDLRRVGAGGQEGMSIRVLAQGAWGYGFTSQIDREGAMNALEVALHMAKAQSPKVKGGVTLAEVKPVERRVEARVSVDPSAVPIEEKISVAMELDGHSRIDPRIVNTNSAYRDSSLRVSFASSEGACLEWNEVRTSLVSYVISFEAGRRQLWYDAKDGLKGFELTKEVDLEEMGRTTSQMAIEMLSAKAPPTGVLDLVFSPKMAGLIAHESFGHASEADDVLKGRSFLAGLVGEKVGSDHAAIVDDPTVERAHGSFPFDSEGTPASRTVLLDGGVLMGYLQTRETAGAMEVKATGNGRAEDFSHRVYSRMTNTFFQPGDYGFEELVEGIEHGIYATKSMGGMEDPVGGGFHVEALGGYLIEGGEVKHLVRKFTLSGKALDVLKGIDAVGKDFELEGGFCGKGEEDIVPVTTGGPHMRVRGVLVGGA